MAELDLAAAPGKYWSSSRAGVPPEEVIEAWAAAAHATWRDETYVTSEAGGAQADFLYNSGHVRFGVCECVLLTAPAWNGGTRFLTVVTRVTADLNLGWSVHTRTLDQVWGTGWPNPYYGEHALRMWERDG